MLTFKVFFKGAETVEADAQPRTAVQMESRRLAPIDVAHIRKTFGAYRLNIDNDLIDREVPALNSSVSISLTEDQAGKVPAFCDKLEGNLVVKVPFGYLNKYLKKKVEKKDGKYRTIYTVDETALFNEWVDSGYAATLGFEAPVNPVKDVPFVGITTID